jgi:hypothetical protein
LDIVLTLSCIVKYLFEYLTMPGRGEQDLALMSDREAKNRLFDAFAEVAKALASGRRARSSTSLRKASGLSKSSRTKSSRALRTRRITSMR